MNNMFRERQRAAVDPIQEQYVANDRIRASQILLVDENGEKLGIKDTRAVLNSAYSMGLDLVVISPNAQPPVAKICDYNKFIYNQRQLKKTQDKKNRENVIITKEIQLRPTTGQHDINVKAGHAREWLEDNCKIKVTLKFKGREMSHKELGFDVMDSFMKQIENCKIEKQPEMFGNSIVAILSPAKSKN